MTAKDAERNAVFDPASGESTHSEISPRNLGLTFCGFFLIVAVLPVMHGHPIRLWSVFVAAAFLAAALLLPSILVPLARWWTRLAGVMHIISTNVLMLLIFFVVITPISLGMKIAGRDHLCLRLDRSVRSYWINREAGEIDSRSLKNQF